MRRKTKLLFPVLLSAALSACVGGTFGNHQEIEMFPLRAATDSEGKDLKRCLKSAHRAQTARMEKTGNYARKPRDLQIDDTCQGFLLAQKGTETGFELIAELREDETTVRWSVNERGVIEEHLEGDDGGPPGESEALDLM